MLSALLVGGIAALAYTGIFDFIENQFYNPAVSETLVRETAKDAELLSGTIFGLQTRFSSLLSAPADIHELSGLFSGLHESVPALHSVRLIDPSGEQIHFSTHPADSAHHDHRSLPFGEVHVPPHEQAHLALDRASGRMIFSFPLHDPAGSHCGAALFAVSARVLTEALAAAGRIGIADNISLAADSSGFVYGLPETAGEEIHSCVCAVWAEGYRSVIPVTASGNTYTLVSARTAQGHYYGRIYSEDVFTFPQQIKTLVLVTIFLTLFLVFFFLFNANQKTPLPEKIAAENRLDLSESKPAGYHEYAGLEELEAAEHAGGHTRADGSPQAEPARGGGLPAAVKNPLSDQGPFPTEKKEAPPAPPRISNVQLAFGDDDIPYIVESSGFRLIDEDINDTIRSMSNEGSEAEMPNTFSSIDDAAEPEDISGGAINGRMADSIIGRPFSVSSDNPQMLPVNPGTMIKEHNGIHYVNSGTANREKHADEKIDRDFVNLVESVVGKK
ncbi:MAG: hypothetical protein FWG46_05990 [Treponema sp.]|nr:hypothetical protein [Treponema sp.]